MKKGFEVAGGADSVDRFVKALASENEAFWVGRDVRLDPSAPPEQLTSQIRYRMRQGVYNELRTVELIAAWIPMLFDPDTGQRKGRRV